MRILLVIVALAFVPSSAVAANADDPPPRARTVAEGRVRYPTLERMIHRFRLKAEARARAQVLASR